MNLIKPKKLKEGDTISIIAPSGEVDINKIKKAAEYFKRKNFKVVLGSNIEKSHNELAGSDEERLEDLHNAFLDKNIDAIICARGGYGALRLINKIDYDIIRNNPKIFCGYSDITILNSVFYKKCGLVTFSGAMAQSDFSGEINSFTENSLFETLTSNCIKLKPTEQTCRREINIEGRLFGGNLTTLASLCGTDFIPEEDFILFIEDICEPAYKIDRCITQLLNIPNFTNNLKAIVCGDFTGLDNESHLQSVLSAIENTLNIPIVQNYPIGHTERKATIPVGGYGELTENSIKISDYMFED